MIIFTAIAAQCAVIVMQSTIHQRSTQAHLHGRTEWRDTVTWYKVVGQVKQVDEHLIPITIEKKKKVVVKKQFNEPI